MRLGERVEQAVRTPVERLPFQYFLPVRSSWLAHRLGPIIYAARALVAIRAESLAGNFFGLEVISFLAGAVVVASWFWTLE